MIAVYRSAAELGLGTGEIACNPANMAEEQRKTRRANDLGETGRYLARNVARIRNAQGLSTVRLSQMLDGAGRSISATAITRVESGERRVDVDDLVALAAALNVNPSALLLPPTAEGSIEVTGAGTVSAAEAWEWMDGEHPLLDADHEDTVLGFQLHARPPGRRSLG
jgi:transcriptional regulator with XRE-family HTH domain